jgi:hypothetical protein
MSIPTSPTAVVGARSEYLNAFVDFILILLKVPLSKLLTAGFPFKLFSEFVPQVWCQNDLFVRKSVSMVTPLVSV